MTNEDRLAAMRWAAGARLRLGKGDALEQRRDRTLVKLIEEEFEALAHGLPTRDAGGIALTADMRLAFDRLDNPRPKEPEPAPELDGLSG
jgi:hypothetical protein